MMTRMTDRQAASSYNVAEAKRRFSDLIGRVAFAGETIWITRRGKPMAKLVPLGTADGPQHLADVKGWLADDDPFLAALDDIASARSTHWPRVLGRRGGRRARPRAAGA